MWFAHLYPTLNLIPQGSGCWLVFGSNIARAEVRINTLFWPSSAASLVEEIALKT